MGIIKKIFGKKEKPVLGKTLFKKDENKNVSVPVQNKGGTILRKPIDRPIQTLIKKESVEPVQVEKKPELSAPEIADRKEWAIKTLPVWQPGDVILDTYEVEDVISGGMGHVYIANHNKWNIKIAIKSPNEMMLSEKDLFARIIREAQSWTELGLHPNIAYCYYVRNIEDVPHIIIEYVDGGNLKDWIEDGKCVDYKLNFDLAIQFCHGMELSHSKGMIHRDIKPANVLMTKDGILKITDFGLVSAGAEIAGKGGAVQKQQPAGSGLTMIGDFMGTEGYLSPEQAESASEVDKKTDIFSFGICLYEMFTGNRPYDITYGPRQEAPDPIRLSKDEKFPLRLAELLKKTVQWDKNDRYKSFKDLKEELNSIYKEIYQKDNPYFDLDLPDMEADNLNNQGMSYMELGDKDKARKCFEKAVAINSIHPQAVYNLSLIRWRAGEIDDIEVLKKLKDCLNNPSIDKEILAELIAYIHLERFASKEAEEVLNDYPGKYKQLIKVTKKQNFDCIRTFEGHIDDYVVSVSFSPDGKLAISGSWDKTLKLWELSTGKCIRTFEGHIRWITDVAFSPDGNFVLSGSKDNTLKLWKIETGKCIHTLKEHYMEVKSCTFSPDGNFVLSGSEDKTIKLWDVKSGECIRTFEGHTQTINSVAFSPDGKLALSGSSDRTLKLWDIDTSKCIRTFEGHTSSVSFSPDGKFSLSLGGSALGDSDNTIKLWDIKTGENIHTLTGHIPQVNSVSFSPDGKFALSGSFDKTLKLWNIETSKCIRTFEGHTSAVFSVSFSPDGKFALSGSGDKTLKLWKIPDKMICISPLKFSKSKRITDLEDQNKTLSIAKELFEKREYHISYSVLFKLWKNKGFGKDKKIQTIYSKLALKGFCKNILILSQRTFLGHTNSVNSISFSPDGSFGLSGSDDKTIKLWQIETGKCIRTFEGHINSIYDVAFSPDGNFALSGSFDKTIKLWKIDTGQCIRTLEGHNKVVFSVSFSPDGNFVLTGSEDKTIKLWDVKSGECIRTFEGHTSGVISVSFSPDGKFALSVGGYNDNTIKLWDIDISKCIRTFDEHTSPASFSPDGKFVLSGSSDKSLKLWDIETGKYIRTFEGHTSYVSSVSFSPDGKFALSVGGYNDNTIKLWDIKTGRCIHTFEGYTSLVSSVSFSPDSRSVLSGIKDSTLKLWEFFIELDFPDNSNNQKILHIEEKPKPVQSEKYSVLNKPTLIKPLNIPAQTLIKRENFRSEPEETISKAIDFYDKSEYQASYSVLFSLWKKKRFVKDQEIEMLYLRLAQKGSSKNIKLLNNLGLKGHADVRVHNILDLKEFLITIFV